MTIFNKIKVQSKLLLFLHTLRMKNRKTELYIISDLSNFKQKNNKSK